MGPLILLFLLGTVIGRTEPHPLDPGPEPRSLTSEDDALFFPGFSIDHGLFGPLTEIAPKDGALRRGSPSEFDLNSDALTFPGFSIDHALSGTLTEISPEVGALRRGSPSEVDLHSDAATFPGFTLLQVLEASEGTLFRDGGALTSGGTKPDTYLFPYLFPGSNFPGFTLGDRLQFPQVPIPSGIARPLTPEDVVEIVSSHRPWAVKGDLVKPIKEVMRPRPLNKGKVSSRPVTSESSPKGKEDLEKVLIPVVIPLKARPSKPRPEYGIQQQKEELTPSAPSVPFFANVLNPLANIPSIKWPSSLSTLIQRLFQDSANKKKNGRLDSEEASKCGMERSDVDPEEALCSGGTQVTSSCAKVCLEEGYLSGSCINLRNNRHSCVCHLDATHSFGLLLKREKIAMTKSKPEVGKRAGGDGADVEIEVGCQEGCRSLGAYSGFCGGSGRQDCFCAVPWHDGGLASAQDKEQ